MMEQVKILFKILYKNGVEDSFEQIVTEDVLQDMLKVNQTIETSMREGLNAHLSLGNEGTGMHIRLSEVVRISTEVEAGVRE